MFSDLKPSDSTVAVAGNRQHTPRVRGVGAECPTGFSGALTGRVHRRKNQHGCSDDCGRFCGFIDRWLSSLPCRLSTHTAPETFGTNRCTTFSRQNGCPHSACDCRVDGWLWRHVDKRFCPHSNVWGTGRINTCHRNHRQFDSAASFCCLGVSSTIHVRSNAPKPMMTTMAHCIVRQSAMAALNQQQPIHHRQRQQILHLPALTDTVKRRKYPPKQPVERDCTFHT